jgi:hypothetical protein
MIRTINKAYYIKSFLAGIVIICCVACGRSSPKNAPFIVARDFILQQNLVSLKQMIATNGAIVRLHADWDKATLLHIAARSHSPEMVKILLEAGSDPNARDDQLRTALHDAYIFDASPEILQLLRQYGADPEVRDAYGKTALAYSDEVKANEGIAK